MTVTEFLAWDAGDPTGVPYQLIDGEPVAMAPASETHAALQAEIGALLRNHLLEQGGKCRLLSQPGIVPRVRSDRNFRIPDLGVTCAPPALGQMVPDPVLLIEILSPGNEAETRANIWAYTTIPSVQEILAVHSTRIEAELLRRAPDGNWPEEPEIVVGADTLRLASIGFVTPLAAIYRTTALTT
ncbi:Uma2 family endonuclease [Rhodopila globiformis]|nr:Uma2 family endonuclease [Rhodopila globiformis]